MRRRAPSSRTRWHGTSAGRLESTATRRRTCSASIPGTTSRGWSNPSGEPLRRSGRRRAPGWSASGSTPPDPRPAPWTATDLRSPSRKASRRTPTRCSSSGRITRRSRKPSSSTRYHARWGGTDFTRYEGGVYSSEWFWSKILHVLREDKKVRAAAFSWVEHCDWMAALLTGTTDPLTMKRSRCAAGHKAMWHPEWGGLPPEQFLVKLDPVLKGLRARLFTET